jgi:hypothetical protein
MTEFESFFEHGLPQAWLPDETLFSLCSRYHVASGNRLASSTCRLLFGHNTQGCAHDFPARLDHFHRLGGQTLGSPVEIIEDRTLLPIYLRFASPKLAERVILAARQSSSGALKFQLGLLTSRFRANHPLKACHLCMQEDERNHLTAYWHRTHQLPGVWVCLQHGCWLSASDLKATGVARFQWVLPAPRQFSYAGEAHPPKAAFALAKLIVSVTEHSGLMLSQELLRATYRHGLKSLGLLGSTGNQRLRHEQAGGAYRSFLDSLPQIDQLEGVPYSTESAAAEIARLISPVRSGAHILRHMMLASWLFDSGEAFLDLYNDISQDREILQVARSVVPLKPGNDISGARKNRFTELLASGLSVSRAAREMGVDTKTGIAWAASRGIATSRRPKLLMPDVRDTLVRLLRRGVSKARCSEVGNISVQSITNLLRSEVGLHRAWKDAQYQIAQQRTRRRWLRCISANPHSGVKAARLAEPAAYAWLYRNDRDWLTTQTIAMDRVARNPQARVEWDRRDQQLSEHVRRVALELREVTPDRRLKLFQIYQRLPELKAKLLKLDRLPLTRSVLYSVLGKK